MCILKEFTPTILAAKRHSTGLTFLADFVDPKNEPNIDDKSFFNWLILFYFKLPVQTLTSPMRLLAPSLKLSSGQFLNARPPSSTEEGSFIYFFNPLLRLGPVCIQSHKCLHHLGWFWQFPVCLLL